MITNQYCSALKQIYGESIACVDIANKIWYRFDNDSKFWKQTYDYYIIDDVCDRFKDGPDEISIIVKIIF